MREVQKVLDQIAYEVQKTVRDVQRSWQKSWKPNLRSSGPAREVRAAAGRLRRVPDHLSDLAAEGNCAMRYIFGYFLKGVACLQGFAGLLTAAIILAVENDPWRNEGLTIGLILLATAQIIWWAGRLVHRSADRRRYEKDQHRLLKLAREKGGNLTVLEAATDTRLTVEKAEEILRELAVRGHAEVRVSESGLIVYYFPEIERWDEVHWAKPVDEL